MRISQCFSFHIKCYGIPNSMQILYCLFWSQIQFEIKEYGVPIWIIKPLVESVNKCSFHSNSHMQLAHSTQVMSCILYASEILMFLGQKMCSFSQLLGSFLVVRAQRKDEMSREFRCTPLYPKMSILLTGIRIHNPRDYSILKLCWVSVSWKYQQIPLCGLTKSYQQVYAITNIN